MGLSRMGDSWSGQTRRQFVQLGIAGLTIPQLFAGSVPQARGAGKASSEGFGRAKSCIVLFAWGGMSHLDTWDLKPNGPSEIRGEFSPIQTSVPGIVIGPHLPLLARQVDRLAIVRSVCHKAADHREAAYWNLTGHQPAALGLPPLMPSRNDWPSLGSQVALFRSQTAKEPAADNVSRPKRSPFIAAQPEPGGARTPDKVIKSVSLSTDVLGPGIFPTGTLGRQDGYTNYQTVELIGTIAESSQARTPLTRQANGPVGDFSGSISGDGTAGDWGSDTHGRGGNLFLAGDGESNQPHTGFGAHANKFITFDLDQIRKRHFENASGPFKLSARVGANGSVLEEAQVQGGVWIDGKRVVLSEELSRLDNSLFFSVYFSVGQRYLTLAMLNGPGNTSYDDTAFRDVQLALIDGDIPTDAAKESNTDEAVEPLGDELPRTISIPYQIADRGLLNGQYGGFLGARYDPIYVRPTRGTPYKGISPTGAELNLNLVPGVSESRLASRLELLSSLETFDSQVRLQSSALQVERNREKAMNMLFSPRVRAAFDLRREPRSMREAYGDHICSQSVMQARRLTEAGVPLVTVYCSAGDLNGSSGDNWDTHTDNFQRLTNDLLPPLDRAASALLTDLADRGTLDNTLVVILTEFGRTPNINAAAGRDHYPACYSVVFAGGGIRGGQVYGRSDARGAAPAELACGPEDLHATIFHALGIDATFEVHDLQGRPYPLCAGKPLPLF
jgi:hypothetical protein